ncbi:putative uncharacterized oxidoreductase [Escovopsis weberi]|uniref:Uncharacterized oxidoreductase n=1 Tax=Escovopsis weberi TaxID=150374 RepID=A0A0M8N0E9_ESCWE|nr:putative uncharacterized oxidoreductase [Escovopsis weberi]
MPEDKGLVLLTGGTGMIGIRILQELLLAGYRVRLAVRTPSKVPRLLADPLVAPHAHRVETASVPDIAAPRAFDEAIRGVRYVVHCASPVVEPHLQGTDYEVTLFRPAERGTLEVLEAAAREGEGVRAAVITASMASIVPVMLMDEVTVYDESARVDKVTGGPYATLTAAYYESKVVAFHAVEKFIADVKPSFKIVNLLPGFVLGPNRMATRPEDDTLVANRIIMAPLLGHALPYPLPPWSAHVDDIARLHVEALALEGGHDDFVTIARAEGQPWAEAADIVRRRFPKEVEAGIFHPDVMDKAMSTKHKASAAKAEKVFGIKWKSFEEQVVDLIEHYLELKRRAE